jgi:hypothetical protein
VTDFVNAGNEFSMTDSEQHPYVEWIASEARRPVLTDPGARDRIMTAVRAEPVPAPVPGWRRLLQPRVFHISPVGSALLAAGLVGIGVLTGVATSNPGGRAAEHPRGVAVLPSQPRVSSPDTMYKFVIVAPQAGQVSLVGDFNDWDMAKTPMIRSGKSGLWTVAVPLSAGRHLYAFVVDGTTWVQDPSAPIAPDDGFGHANSVKLVVRGSSS